MAWEIMKSALVRLVVIIAIGSVSTQCSRAEVRGSTVIVKQERSAQPISGLYADGSFDIELTQGKEPALVVEADDNIVSLVKTEYQGQDLRIYLDQSNIKDLSFEHIRIYVTVPSIDAIHLNGPIELNGHGMWKMDQLNLFTQGPSDVHLDIQGELLATSIDGPSVIELHGHMGKQSIHIQGPGKYHAGDLESTYATVVIKGSGKVELNVRSALQVAITGPGIVSYSGSPQVSSQINGPGRLIQRS